MVSPTYFNYHNKHNGPLVDLDVDDDTTASEAQWAEWVELAQALSCFSFLSSRREYMLANLHGYGTRLLLPDVHWAGGYDPFFDAHNHGDPAIARFTAAHTHNRFCLRLAELFDTPTLGFPAEASVNPPFF
jgi:hypothetical protein